MKVSKFVFCIIIGWSILFAQGYYPVFAFHCKDTTWFKNAGPDSLGLNTVLFSDLSYSKEEILAKLDAANNAGLKAIVGHARKGPALQDDLCWYCMLHKRVFEAEDSSSFSTWNGDVVVDTFAGNDTAFVAYKESHNADNMLLSIRDRTRFYTLYRTLDVIYSLKIDSVSLDTLAQNVKVCSLYVLRDATLLTQAVLTAGDFSQIDSFKACSLTHTFQHYKKYYYGIYWFDNCDLYCDKIEAEDRDVEALLAGDYNTALDQITYIYDTKPAMAFYYLLDEPYEAYFAANGYIINYLHNPLANHKPGIQVVWCDWDVTYYEKYMDVADPDSFFMINYYPFMGSGWNPPTPPDSGSIFQGRIDDLCEALTEARTLTIQNGSKLWYLCQSFGQYDSVTGQTKGYREPTPRELKCTQWLALAYGVKSIGYFLYPTEKEKSASSTWYDSGLVDQSVNPPRHRDSLWIPAQAMNFTLQEIGSTLMGLTSDTVFKASDGPSSDCFIKKVWIWNGSDSLLQIGTFHNANEDSFFIIVNRHCLDSESLEVVVGLSDTTRFLYDCYNHEAIAFEWITGMTQPPFYYRIKLNPGEGRLFRLIPFQQQFKINQDQTYANVCYAALRTNATSAFSIDSMKIWQVYGGSQVDSTAWIPYDTAYCWQMLDGEGINNICIKYKLDGSIVTPEYSDVIQYDITAPSGSFVINDDDKFTNNAAVSLKNSFTDSAMAKMRFGNEYLKNFVINSGFNDTTSWQSSGAVYDSTLDLYEIPSNTDTNFVFQIIPADSLEDFENDTMLLWVDLVSDNFMGTGIIKFEYIYDNPDSIDPESQHPLGDSLGIAVGTHAYVSLYNRATYFEYAPDTTQTLYAGRVSVFTYGNIGNTGRIFIDNLRLDVVGPAYDYTPFETYDTLKQWTLNSGNGIRKVYGQFSDAAGNETSISFDSIIVDTTKPARKIASPQNNQIINDTITITGWAHDSLDDPPHFKQYELQHKAQMSANWYGNDPDSLLFTPKYPIQMGPFQMPAQLGDWNTYQVDDGWYDLKLTVTDSAGNTNDTTVSVHVNNFGEGEGMMSGFTNYVYGLAVGNDVFIGEYQTGRIYQYSTTYEPIDTFVVSDSTGTGLPLVITNDDSGMIWIANCNSHLINRYTPKGELLFQFAGGFSFPSGIAFDKSGNIWVSDRMHHQIKKFSRSGDSLFTFGTYGADPGEIDRPFGIAFYNDHLYIADSRNKRISVFDTLGNFVKIFADSTTLNTPFGIAIDSTGCLFVSDVISHRVLEFDPCGNRLFTIDSLLNYPTSLALSSDAKLLYVSDTKNKRVVMYEVRGEPEQGGGPQSQGDNQLIRVLFEVNPSIAAGRMIIKLHGFIGKTVTLRAYDITGRIVKTFYNNDVLKTNQSISWDGRDDANRKLPNGIYFIRFEADDWCKTEKVILLK